MKKKWLTTAIVLLMLIAGLSLMLYPTVSDYIQSMSYRRVIADYKKTVEAMDEDAYNEFLEAARSYNERVAMRGGSLLTVPEADAAEYASLLDVTGTGVMGYVAIEKIDIALPIYHGTDDAVLQSGVGHLSGSSLPVGGASTHTLLSGHTGLPSSKLFTNIDQLAEGDTFTIRVLKEVLTYEVDEIRVVLPNKVGSLCIIEGEDYCTLVTCTPYGVNTHRLLVRGHRVPTPEEPEEQNPTQQVFNTEDGRLFGIDAEIAVLILICAAVVLIVLIVVIVAVIKRKRRTRKRNIL